MVFIISIKFPVVHAEIKEKKTFQQKIKKNTFTYNILDWYWWNENMWFRKKLIW